MQKPYQPSEKVSFWRFCYGSPSFMGGSGACSALFGGGFFRLRQPAPAIRTDKAVNKYTPGGTDFMSFIILGTRRLSSAPPPIRQHQLKKRFNRFMATFPSRFFTVINISESMPACNTQRCIKMAQRKLGVGSFSMWRGGFWSTKNIAGARTSVYVFPKTPESRHDERHTPDCIFFLARRARP